MWCKIEHDVSRFEIAESIALQAIKLMDLGESASKFEGNKFHSNCKLERSKIIYIEFIRNSKNYFHTLNDVL